MDEALADEAYKKPENTIGKFGISWFERWTQASGRKLRDEPDVDAFIGKFWKERIGKKNYSR